METGSEARESSEVKLVRLYKLLSAYLRQERSPGLAQDLCLLKNGNTSTKRNAEDFRDVTRK